MHIELPSKVNLISNFQVISKLYTDMCISSLKIIYVYNSIYFRTFKEKVDEKVNNEKNNNWNSKSLDVLYNSWLKSVDRELDRELKSDYFGSLLYRYVNSLIELRSAYKKIAGKYIVDYFDFVFDLCIYNLMVLLSIPRERNLSSFDVVYSKEKVRLLHYQSNDNRNYATNSQNTESPLLIIYAPINRFYIMDLNPKTSVVRNLISSRLDVYLLDWGYPISSKGVGGEQDNQNLLSLSDYINYINDAVQTIKDRARLEKVPILGYCWGGILALIYTSLNNKSVKNLSLMATPVDFSKDNTILANWSRASGVDRMMDEFTNISGQVFDLLFIMRNPPRYAFDKYLRLFKKLDDKDFVKTFFDVENWLYDTPPIPSSLYGQIINDCYKNNLLITPNGMKIDGKGIDLRNVNVPLLVIDAEKDDLVTGSSSMAVSEYVSSKEKEFLINPGGHVALCIGDTAHKELWPKVAKWIISKK